METLENALSLLLEHTAALTETEALPLMQCLGRIAAEDIVSGIDQPPFDRSPLDGYALRSSEIADATPENPVLLKVIGEADAGCGTHFHPAPGEALRLMTGAPVPAECDCVIRQEDTDEGMDTVRIYKPVRHNQNICWAGEDMKRGHILARKGERLTAVHLAVLSGAGVCTATVYRRPKVALLCTGDELLQPGEPLTYGKIYDSSRAYLTARLYELGAELIPLGEVPDDPQAAADLLLKTIGDADLLITTGGVSVGKKDIMHQVLPLMNAERLFWRVALKPGTPMMAGMVSGKLIICLSGNPFAAISCFEIFASCVIRKLAGSTDFELHRCSAVMADAFPKGGSVRRLVRARFNGEKITFPGDNHSSGSIASMINCNCLIDIPADTGALSSGQSVGIILL